MHNSSRNDFWGVNLTYKPSVGDFMHRPRGPAQLRSNVESETAYLGNRVMQIEQSIAT